MEITIVDTKIDTRRSVLSYGKIQKIISALIRNNSLFMNKKQKGCYVDVGCGPNITAEFCNIDYHWKPGVDCCCDITRGLPFEDQYFAGLYSEHMLEHLSFSDALALLREFRRVLMPGAVARIAVPDGEIYLAEYARHLNGAQARMPYQEHDESDFPFVTPMISVNRIFRAWGHQFIWDFETLRRALLAAGFDQVEKKTYRVSADPKLVRDTLSREAESLYVEAR